MDFDKYWQSNTEGTLFGPPIDPAYSDSLLKSTRILRSSNSNFEWFGALSTVRAELNDRLTLSGGVDLRTYHGESYATVYDLLGGDYFVDQFDANDNEPMHVVGDTIAYHNDSFVRWAGVFALLEYKDLIHNAFINVSGVSQGYRRVDYFREQDEFGNPNTSVWHTIPGYTIKLGGNRKLNEFSNVFVNMGLLNRTPVFRNVFDFENELFANIKNEIIHSFELGASHSKGDFSINLNAYYTDWNNRPIFGGLGFEDPVTGRRVRVTIPSMSAVHQGVETDFAWRLNSYLTAEGYFSYGDWRWTSSEDSLLLIDAETNLPFFDGVDSDGSPIPAVISYDAAGVSVGDAPQTTASLGLRYSYKGLYVKPRYTYFARYYSEFDPFTLYDENAGRESWRIPDYGLLDVHVGYRFKFGEYPANVRLSFLNVLNTTYIVNAQNNDATGEWYYRDEVTRYPIFENNFDALPCRGQKATSPKKTSLTSARIRCRRPRDHCRRRPAANPRPLRRTPPRWQKRLVRPRHHPVGDSVVITGEISEFNGLWKSGQTSSHGMGWARLPVSLPTFLKSYFSCFPANLGISSLCQACASPRPWFKPT